MSFESDVNQLELLLNNEGWEDTPSEEERRELERREKEFDAWCQAQEDYFRQEVMANGFDVSRCSGNSPDGNVFFYCDNPPGKTKFQIYYTPPTPEYPDLSECWQFTHYRYTHNVKTGYDYIFGYGETLADAIADEARAFAQQCLEH